jgi:hypothetical protein
MGTIISLAAAQTETGDLEELIEAKSHVMAGLDGDPIWIPESLIRYKESTS